MLTIVSHCQIQGFTGFRRDLVDFPVPCLGHFLASVFAILVFSLSLDLFAGLLVLQTSGPANHFCMHQSQGVLYMLLDSGTSPSWDPSPRQFQFQRGAALPVISCHPSTSVPAGHGEVPCSHGLRSWAVLMAHHLLMGSRIQLCAGEKCTFGVCWCFPMVTQLKLDKFPW